MIKENNKIIFISGFFLFLIPFFNFFTINFYEVIDQFKFIFFLTLLIFLTLFFFSSKLISYFINIRFEINFFYICFFFFIQFYFKFLSDTFEDFGIKGGASLETIFFILLIFIFFIFLQYKKNNIFFKFFFIFTILNLIYNSSLLIKNIYEGSFFTNQANSKNFFLKKNHSIVGDNIYLIFLDGMVSLEKAKKYLDINDNEFKKYLKKNDFEYIENIKSLTVSTRHTFGSFFNLDPLTLNFKEFKNRPKLLFPGTIKNSKLLEILKNNNYKFRWVGNTWMDCFKYDSDFCLNDQNNVIIDFLNVDTTYYFLETLFQNTLLHKIVVKINSLKNKKIYYNQMFFDSYKLNSDNDPSKSPINYRDALKNFLYFYSKTKLPNYNNFFFIHNLAPHPPFIFDKNCNYKNSTSSISTEDEFNLIEYKYNYICAQKNLIEFIKFIKNENPNAHIFIAGDHGWNLEKEKDELKKLFSRYDIFAAITSKSLCKLNNSNITNLNYFKSFLNCILGTSLSIKNNTTYYEKDNKINIYK